ncbi:MAG: hypothetical protein EOP68_13780, partial [Sphingomonas sp.]
PSPARSPARPARPRGRRSRRPRRARRSRTRDFCATSRIAPREVVTRVQSEQRRRKLKIFLGGTAALGAAYVLLLGVEILQRGLAA